MTRKILLCMCHLMVKAKEICLRELLSGNGFVGILTSTRFPYEMMVSVLGRSILCDCFGFRHDALRSYDSTVLCRLGEDEKA